jgi:hypothetical protein
MSHETEQLARHFLTGIFLTGRAVHPLTGRDLTADILVEARAMEDEAIEEELKIAHEEGQLKTVRSARGMVMKTHMPAVVAARFEKDLGPGALKDKDTLKTLARLHPEFFPKEVAGGTGRVFAVGKTLSTKPQAPIPKAV